jgi:hypothetical protein
MKSSDKEEHQRVMGFRTSLWPWLEPGRGQASREEDGGQTHLPSLRHPIAWVRWRTILRRQGPYAPDFQDFRRTLQSGTEEFQDRLEHP